MVPAAAAAAAAAVAAAAAAVIEGELIGFASAHYRYLDGIQGRSGTRHLIDCYIGSYFCHLHFFGPWVFYMHHSPYTAAILNIYLLASIPVIRNRQAIAVKNDGGVICGCIFLPLACDGHGVVMAENNIGHFEHIACQHKQFFLGLSRCCLIIIGLECLQVDVLVKCKFEENHCIFRYPTRLHRQHLPRSNFVIV